MKSKIRITDECPDVSVVGENRLARKQTITKWLLGHAASIHYDRNPETITMTVGEHRFSDRRAEYPSEKLIAAMSLAIYAGEGLCPSDFDIQDLDDETVRAVMERGVADAVIGTDYRSGKPTPFASRRGLP
jgi:hypothetical protein